MTPPKKTLRQQGEEHWIWIESVLQDQMRVTERLFIDAFVHGYKHAKEDKK